MIGTFGTRRGRLQAARLAIVLLLAGGAWLLPMGSPDVAAGPALSRHILPPAVSRHVLPPAVSRHVLRSGLTALIKETPADDLVAIEVLVRSGPRVEAPAEAGISSFVQGTVLRGTARRTAEDIALAVEGVGGVLRAGTGADYSELSIVAPTRHLQTALEVLADLVTNAKFDPADIETQRRVSLSRIRQQADQPLNRALDLVAARLFPMHPYSIPLVGTAETVTALGRDQLLAFYRTYYTAQNMIVIIAANVDAQAMLPRIARAFEGVRTTELPRRLRLLPVVERALAPRPAGPHEVREIRQTAAAWIAQGYLGVPVGHRDWAALRVASGVLGEGLSSRLFVEIREKQGLAYQVGAAFPTRAGPSPVILLAGTDPKNVSKVTDGLAREITRLRESPVPPEEMDRARQRIIGRHAIDHEDLQRQAFLVGWYELLGVGASFDSRLPELIAAVRAEDVQRAARLYLQNHVLAIVLPPAR